MKIEGRRKEGQKGVKERYGKGGKEEEKETGKESRKRRKRRRDMEAENNHKGIEGKE